MYQILLLSAIIGLLAYVVILLKKMHDESCVSNVNQKKIIQDLELTKNSMVKLVFIAGEGKEIAQKVIDRINERDTMEEAPPPPDRLPPGRKRKFMSDEAKMAISMAQRRSWEERRARINAARIQEARQQPPVS